MAETNITADKVNGEVIKSEDVNELKDALVTTLSGRDSVGTLKAGEHLGSATYPWGLGYINGIVSNGSLIDFSSLASQSNKITSGQTRAMSEQADFLRASGSGATASIQGGTTSLVTVINGATVITSSTINLTSLTTASSGSSSECIINDAALAGQASSKYIGSENDAITIDATGANITSQIEKLVCLKAPAGELMLAYVKSSTSLTNIKRGYFFNSTGAAIVRETLANNDTLTLMSLGFVFLENNGSTVEVSYLNPAYSFETPNSPATGQYWFDLQSQQWKRYDGSNFIVINRVLIGLLAIDATDCIGSRSLDFNLAYSEANSLIFNEFNDTSISSRDVENLISVNGNDFFIKNKIVFNITTDLATGLTEAVNTTYYLYITQSGERKLDTEKPYRKSTIKKGYYHPSSSWRCVASSFNDASGNLTKPIAIDSTFETGATTSLKGVSLLHKQVTCSNGTDEEHDIDFTAGNFQFDDGTGQASISALTKQLDGAWVAGNNQGGIDSGAVAVDTTYHCFAIYNPASGVSDFLYSTSLASPILPSGYTKKKYRMSILTDGASNIIPFTQDNRHIEYNSSRIDYSASSGIPTTYDDLLLSTPKGIRVKAFISAFWDANVPGFSNSVIIKDKISGIEKRIVANYETDSMGFSYIYTDLNKEIQHKANRNNCDLYTITTYGWEIPENLFY